MLVVESREAGNNVCAIENNRPISGRQGRLIHIGLFGFGLLYLDPVRLWLIRSDFFNYGIKFTILSTVLKYPELEYH